MKLAKCTLLIIVLFRSRRQTERDGRLKRPLLVDQLADGHQRHHT
jgi:hypothetical protein